MCRSPNTQMASYVFNFFKSNDKKVSHLKIFKIPKSIYSSSLMPSLHYISIIQGLCDMVFAFHGARKIFHPYFPESVKKTFAFLVSLFSSVLLFLQYNRTWRSLPPSFGTLPWGSNQGKHQNEGVRARARTHTTFLMEQCTMLQIRMKFKNINFIAANVFHLSLKPQRDLISSS